jgi:DNA repair protein RadD
VSAVLQAPAFTLRPYQREAVDAGVEYLRSPKNAGRNGLLICPTGSGKSLIIAEIVANLDGPALVFQPSKEILQQNFQKLMHYGFRPGVYSASLGKKQVSGAVTLATIGSVVNKPEHFDHIKYVLIDEAHLVNSRAGMYKDFLGHLPDARIAGLTATPYRLSTTSEGPMLKFLTRTRPAVFDDVVYYVQNGQLFRDGHLAKLEYHQIKGFDRSKLQANSTGAEYTDESVKRHFRELNFADKTVRVVERLLEIGRNGVLVFTRFVEESRQLVEKIPGAALVSAETSSFERARILKEFKAGNIRVVANCGVLTTGFDYPELDTVVLARPTLSLGLYYQKVGRAVRPHPSKSHAMIIDMVGLVDQFGKVEDLELRCDRGKLWYIASRGKQLTNVVFGKPGR